MIEIKQCILKNNDCYKKGQYITPTGIMVHSTGANNPYLSRYVQPDDGLLGQNKYNNHWNQGGSTKCVHAFIGKDKNGVVRCYQTLPWDMRGWHAGYHPKYPKNSANGTHIGFEICEDDLKDPAYCNIAYHTAVELCAFLCDEFGINPDNIIGHYEGHDLGIACNHGDPKNWWSKHGKSMNQFRAEVKSKMGITTMPEYKYYKVSTLISPLNVRNAPGGDVIGSFAKGEIVKSANLMSGWVYTESIDGSIKGYVSSKYLKETTSPVETPVDQPPTEQPPEDNNAVDILNGIKDQLINVIAGIEQKISEISNQ